MHRLVGLGLLFWLCAGCQRTEAPVRVDDAWVRASAPGQNNTAGYMRIRSGVPAKLVGVKAAFAQSIEIHHTSMDGGVMRMRPVAELDLPAGQTVKLEPGGYHLMIMGVKEPLAAGQQVGLTLVIAAQASAESSLEVRARVAERAP